MILDPSKPPAPKPRPVDPPGVRRVIEKIEGRGKARRGPIRPKKKLPPSRLARMAPPTDAAAVEAGVAAYLAQMTASDEGDPGPWNEPAR